MTKSILTALAAAAILASPMVVTASAAPAKDKSMTVAQTQVPSKCAQLTDAKARAACMKRESGG